MADPRTVIVMVAPNGSRLKTSDHPALPITPQEIATTAQACQQVGASMLHLHVRTESLEQHTLSVMSYKTAITAIRQQLGHQFLIQVTSEAAGIFTCAQQIAMVQELKPEFVSVALRELTDIPSAPQRKITDFFAWTHQQGIAIQHILYTPCEFECWLSWHQQGYIPGTLPAVLWVLGDRQRKAQPSDLLGFLQVLSRSGLQDQLQWMVAAFGELEWSCLLPAAVWGGQTRVGFENNLYLADGQRAPDNASLVAQLAKSLTALGFHPATPTEARKLWALSR